MCSSHEATWSCIVARQVRAHWCASTNDFSINCQYAETRIGLDILTIRHSGIRHSGNFPFPGPTQLSGTFPYCKQRKAGRGLVTRLSSLSCKLFDVVEQLKPGTQGVDFWWLPAVDYLLIHLKHQPLSVFHLVCTNMLASVPGLCHCPIFDCLQHAKWRGRSGRFHPMSMST